MPNKNTSLHVVQKQWVGPVWWGGYSRFLCHMVWAQIPNFQVRAASLSLLPISEGNSWKRPTFFTTNLNFTPFGRDDDNWGVPGDRVCQFQSLHRFDSCLHQILSIPIWFLSRRHGNSEEGRTRIPPPPKDVTSSQLARYSSKAQLGIIFISMFHETSFCQACVCRHISTT